MRQGLAIAVAGLLLSACSRSPPPIASGIPVSTGPTSFFGDRVKQQFPGGFAEATLMAELRNQRFAISETRDSNGLLIKSALYEDQHFPCNESWTIQWTSESGKIKEISGIYSGERCL